MFNEGGGIYLKGFNAIVIKNCFFDKNQAYNGGALYMT